MTPRPRRHLRSAAVAACVVLGAAGTAACRQPDRLDMERARRRIGDSLRATYRLPVDQVECPTKVAVEVGDSFSCSVRIAGHALDVTVTQRTADGDLRVTPRAAVLVMDDVREDLKRTLAAEFDRSGLRAGCGAAAVRVLAPGATFECKVADSSGSRLVTVKVRDVSGTLAYTIEPA